MTVPGGADEAPAAEPLGPDEERAAGALSLSCVILTQGSREAELTRAVGSVAALDGDPVEVVVVGNGADVPALPAPVTVVRLSQNEGVPGGRNRGIEASGGAVLLFLDDDGWYPDTGLAEHVRRAFAADPRLGILSFRVVDPQGGPGQRRHVPRVRADDPLRSSQVTTFLGGACAIRREVFDRVGSLPDDFFYGHEETDLAWRALDAGFRVCYDADARMCHPPVLPTRHAEFYRFNARNRVWLARRNLPAPLLVLYLLDWVLVTMVRERRMAALRPWFRGFREGWRRPCGPRRPMRWSTAFRMGRLGRPPVI